MEFEPNQIRSMILREVITKGTMTRYSLKRAIMDRGVSEKRFNYLLADKRNGLISKGILREKKKNRTIRFQTTFKSLCESVNVLLSDEVLGNFVRYSLIYWVNQSYISPHGDVATIERKSPLFENKGEIHYGISTVKDYKIDLCAENFNDLDIKKLLYDTRGETDTEFNIAYFLTCWEMRRRFEYENDPSFKIFSDYNTLSHSNESILQSFRNPHTHLVPRSSIWFGFKKLVFDPIKYAENGIEVGSKTHNERLGNGENYDQNNELRELTEKLKFIQEVDMASVKKVLSEWPRMDETYYHSE